ncbi:MAG: hypothetical protein R2851_15905 [Caldilineaceae bacterium]
MLVRFERSALLVTGVIVGAIATSVVAVWLSQVYATTPTITGTQGNVVPGSIATLEQVGSTAAAGGSPSAAHDVDNPVLLFLAGGLSRQPVDHRPPRAGRGSSNTSWWSTGNRFRRRQIVQARWMLRTLTPGTRYVSDGHALVLYLRERFGVEKVYVLGESWGQRTGHHAGAALSRTLPCPHRHGADGRFPGDGSGRLRVCPRLGRGGGDMRARWRSWKPRVRRPTTATTWRGSR